MPLPRIAIVGRPNVGKSSLFNMLARDKVAIVDPTPGVTRDRVSTVVTLDPPPPVLARGDEHPAPEPPPLRVELTDTGGFGVYVADGRRYNEVGADLSTLTADIERQIAEAVSAADIILFVIDAQTGVTPHDEEIARMLRKRALGRADRPDLPVVILANKVDGPRWEAHGAEAASLGFGQPLLVSAKNNYMRRDLIDRLYAMISRLPAAQEQLRGETEPETGELRIAIIGKRNAGKSTLVNTLAGEQRVIVSEIAGTTRDAVDVRFEMDGRAFVAIDTAGLRRKKSFADRVEWWAFDRAQRSIERADVVLLLVDATERISQVDQQLAMLVQKSYKPVVIVVNKWDLVEGRPGRTGRPVTARDYEKYIRKELKGLSFAPISLISAEDGLNVRETVGLAFELHEQSSGRVSTGRLNRIVQAILAERGPSSKLGTFVKTYYVAQVGVAPPTIAIVVNHPELFTANYERFLINRFREQLPFAEVPIRLNVRGRSRRARGDRREEESDHPLTPETIAGDLGDDPEAYFDDEEND